MTRRSILAVLAAATLAACGGDDDEPRGPGLPDHPTGPVSSVPKVAAAKTVLGATADTHEVETDGKWIVWRGRQIALSYFDGSKLSTLDLGLSGAVTPWAFNDCDRSPVAYDGTTLAFVARDVSSAGGPALHVARPGGAARKIALPFTGGNDLYAVGIHVWGDRVAVWDFGLDELRSIDVSAAAPAWSANLMPAEGSALPPGGGLMPFARGGQLELLDLATGALTPLTGDGNEGTTPAQVRHANGVFTWVEGSQAYAFEAGASEDSALVADTEAGKSNPVAGPGYFAWNEEGSQVMVRVGAAAPVPAGIVRDLASVQAGDGFLAFVAADDTGAQQLFAYDLSDLTATDAVQVSRNGAQADAPNAGFSMQVDGSRVYAVFDYERRHIPGKSLVSYDFATSTLTELITSGEVQRVPVVRAAGGKAIVLHADQAFRLFAKAAGSSGKPAVLTAPTMAVEQFTLAEGLVSFIGMDRAYWAPEMITLLRETVGQGATNEVYYLDLDGDRALHRVTQNTARDREPASDGRWITWYQDGQHLGFGYDTQAGQLRLVGTAEHQLVVAGGVAVWRDGNTLRKADLATGAAEVLWQGSSIQKCPDLTGTLLTWNDDTRVVYVDLADPEAEPTVVEGSHAAYVQNYGTLYWYQGPVATDGRYLTWVDARQSWTPPGAAGPLDANVVVVHDTQTGVTVDLPAADWSQTGWETAAYEDGNAGAVCNPRISDGVVVFNAIEYGADNVDGDKEVFYAKLGDLAAAAPTVVRLTSDAHDDAATADVDESAALWDSRVQVSHGLVVWRTGGTSRGDYWNGMAPAAARLP